MAWDEQSASTGLDECAALVRSAEALCSGAPELAVQLAQRALAIGTGVTARDPMAFADIGQARSLSMRAQAVLAGGLVRISHHADAVEPAFAALALAEVTSATEFAAAVRLDLAVCAREVGEPVLGGAVLRPVLESPDVRPSMRALALSRLVTCVGHLARRDDLEDALGEADRLVAADDRLSPDARRVERARLSVRTAAYHRWYGDTEDAVAAAKAGLGMLNRLRRELRAECDRLRAQLVLELVCALLDEGELAEAESAAESVVGEPVRATSAAAVGQLMLAVSTRVLLPSGQVGRGREMLAQSVWMAERHGLDALLADSLTELSHLDEQAGRTTDALEALRSARAAEQRRVRAIARASRLVLTEVGAADVGAKAVTSLLRQASRSGHTVPAPHATRGGRPGFAAAAGSLSARSGADETPGLLNREGLFRRLRSVRNGERPVALTLLRFEPVRSDVPSDVPSDIDLAELAGRVRAIAPDNAELASPAGDELAVLLPHTTSDQAERFAATIRESARATDWPADRKGNDLSISTGVVQSAAPTTEDDTVDAGALLTAARHALGAPEPTERGGSATEPRSPRPTRLHAAGTTAADRQDPTSHPSHSAASPNTAGTRSGYFDIPKTTDATTEPTPRTGTYATDTGAGPTSPGTAPGPGPTSSPAAGSSTYAAGGSGGPGTSTGSFAAGTGSGSYAVPGPAETARDAAASASEAADTAREAAARSTGARRRAQSADTPFGDDEEPTRPLPNVTGASESLTVGRAILSSLSIPKGSGGRRRAPGEQTANNLAPQDEPHPGDPQPRWPATPGPRTTGDPQAGWPQTPGPRTAGDTTHDWPSWSTTPNPTDPNTGWPPSTANQSTTSPTTDQQPVTTEPAAPAPTWSTSAEPAPATDSGAGAPASAGPAWGSSPTDTSGQAPDSGADRSTSAGSSWGASSTDSSGQATGSGADRSTSAGASGGASAESGPATGSGAGAPASAGPAWGSSPTDTSGQAISSGADRSTSWGVSAESGPASGSGAGEPANTGPAGGSSLSDSSGSGADRSTSAGSSWGVSAESGQATGSGADVPASAGSSWGAKAEPAPATESGAGAPASAGSTWGSGPTDSSGPAPGSGAGAPASAGLAGGSSLSDSSGSGADRSTSAGSSWGASAESGPATGSGADVSAGAGSTWGAGVDASADARTGWGSRSADSSPATGSGVDAPAGAGSASGSSPAESSAPTDAGSAWGAGAAESGTGWGSGTGAGSAGSTDAQGGVTAAQPGDADSMAGSRWGAGDRGPGESAEEEQRSAYEQTKAELARMMSALTAGNLDVTPGDPAGTASIPTPPDSDPVPAPSRRPEIPEPPEPDPIPPTPDEPQPVEPGPPPASEPLRETATTSALRAALEPFGGIPERSGPPEVSRTSRPPGSARSAAGTTGPDRAAGAAEITGPAGSGEVSGSGEAARSTPAEPSGSARGARSAEVANAAIDWSADITRSPDTPSTTQAPAKPALSDPASGSTQAGKSARAGWLADPAAKPDSVGEASGPTQTGKSARAGWLADAAAEPTRSDPTGEASGSTQAGRSARAGWLASPADSPTQTAGPEASGLAGSAKGARSANAAIDWSADITRSSDTPAAGETSVTAGETTSEEPIIGPQPRPPDTPSSRRETARQRGDRSDSTTIAGLLAEALAAYQSTADDEDDYHPPRAEPAPRPPLESFGGFDTFADRVHGRHRSPE